MFFSLSHHISKNCRIELEKQTVCELQLGGWNILNFPFDLL